MSWTSAYFAAAMGLMLDSIIIAMVTLIESKWNLLCQEITRWSKLLGKQQMVMTPQL